MRNDDEEFDLNVEDGGEAAAGDDEVVSGVEGAVEDDVDAELHGNVAERLVAGVCDDELPWVEESVGVVGVTGAVDERIEKAWEHRLRTRDVEGKDGNGISSSTNPPLGLADDNRRSEAVLTADSVAGEQVLWGLVIPGPVRSDDVEVAVCVCC